MRSIKMLFPVFLLILSCQETEKVPNEKSAVSTVEELKAEAEKGESEINFELKQADYIDRAKLYDSIMKQHSELSPIMIRFNKSRSTLAYYSSNEYKDKIDKSLSDAYAEQLNTLEKIHQQKMDWMNKFDQNYAERPHEEAMNYLLGKKDTIEQIRKSFISELDKADEMIKKVKN